MRSFWGNKSRIWWRISGGSRSQGEGPLLAVVLAFWSEGKLVISNMVLLVVGGGGGVGEVGVVWVWLGFLEGINKTWRSFAWRRFYHHIWWGALTLAPRHHGSCHPVSQNRYLRCLLVLFYHLNLFIKHFYNQKQQKCLFLLLRMVICLAIRLLTNVAVCDLLISKSEK